MCLLFGMGLVCASVCEAEAQKKPPAAEPTDANRELAKRHNDLGMNHYNLGEFDEAVTEFKAAYALTSEPGLLFNIAQAYRLKEDYKQALYFYKTYLRLVPDAANRADVERWIRELDRLRRRPCPPRARSGSRTRLTRPVLRPPGKCSRPRRRHAGAASRSPG
jgi:tetratricopeptide (TPR) repeat protein